VFVVSFLCQCCSFLALADMLTQYSLGNVRVHVFDVNCFVQLLWSLVVVVVIVFLIIYLFNNFYEPMKKNRILSKSFGVLVSSLSELTAESRSSLFQGVFS